jgi:aspartyl-tRNA(Asn)/glutamyl-tRNA(Gln) amidotransferase subunit B
MEYSSYIGLEIHIQLLTQTKVFCSCRAAFGQEPNTNVCPVCLGYPGVLPALNERAMQMSYLVARALNCEPAATCSFDRKNYFYPDLPKNYQISQFASPLGTNGYLDVALRGQRKRVRIKECHLEEDAGKMVHAGDQSLLDFNRAGTPLLEIVTEPDLEIGEEAELLLQQFRRLVRYLQVCDGNMEEGSLRCDANVSVGPAGTGLGTKVEIKNLNSSRFVRKALDHEISRQTDILERGGTVVQETRLWNENRDLTESMRTKEGANDYRYFPEPDLPVFRADAAFLSAVESALVELPEPRRERLMREFGLDELQAQFICDERSTADYFERCLAAGAPPAAVATWLMGDVRKHLNRTGVPLKESPLSAERLAELLSLLETGRIHGKIAKQVLAAVFTEDEDPGVIIRDRGWEQITDAAEIAGMVDEVFAANPQALQQIRDGDSRPRGYLVGQIMKRSGGRADPRIVQRVVAEKLDVRFIELLTFGGAITGRRRADGLIVSSSMEAGGARDLLAAAGVSGAKIRIAELGLGSFLSEEISPVDWALLVDAVSTRLADGSAAGIVITHGTDTLAYSAALVHRLFGHAGVPIVFTASATPPDAGQEAAEHLCAAVELASTADPGVYVSYGPEVYSPLNLRFEAVSHGRAVFTNWNMEEPVYRRSAAGRSGDLPGGQALTTRFEAAMRQVFVARVFPGMQSRSLISIIDSGVRFVILELYDTGTANLRESPFSLREALRVGAERGVLFLCTSQQRGVVDFSEYVTSHELWREGALPMGPLTTESAYARLIASLLVEDDWSPQRVKQIMEAH